MSCDANVLGRVPLFSLLDDDERAVLASHVEVRQFERNERIYHRGGPGGVAYVVLSGQVRVTLVDEDQREVTIDEPSEGGFFGFASLLDDTPHQTSASSIVASVCLEIDREDLRHLLRQKPEAGMDMLAVLGKHFHATQRLVQARSVRDPNAAIEEAATTGDRVADAVARFGGSWRFIILFAVVLAAYTLTNVLMRSSAWDPYPFILLNLFLSMLAAVQAPVIMMSQNRQDAKDRLRSEMDFEVNRRAEAEIRSMSRKLHDLEAKLDGMTERPVN